MSDTPVALALRHLRRLVDGSDRLEDHELIERFVIRREEAAFEALLRRHGPLVLGVCQRLLSDRHDVEDAFQATFLVLVRRAGSIRKLESVSAWLYGVAYRIARKTRNQTARRRRCEARARQCSAASRLDEITGRELYAVLDEELTRLPADFRAALILCYLEGKTRAEAARQLGWTLGTLKRRLEQARTRLHARLTRRGMAPSFALFAATFAGQEHATALSAPLASGTLRKAMEFGLSSARAVSPPGRASVLADAILRGIYMTKIKSALVCLLVCAGVTVGPGLLLRESLVAQSPPAQPPDKPPLAQARDKQAASTNGPQDSHFDPTPLARRVWALICTVEKNDIEPRPRATMLSDGARSLFKAAKVEPPANLAERTAKLNTEQALASLLRDVWPRRDTSVRVPDNQLEDAFLQGVLEAIPGKPDLMPADIVRVTEQSQGNRYVGIGLQLTMNKKEKYPEIVSPTRRGPLREAGAKAGDLIVEVDGKDTHGVGLRTVVDWIRGEEGTPVTIAIRKPGEKANRPLHLRRSVVPFQMVEGYRRAGEGWTYRIDPATPMAYVHIASITSGTLHELRQLEPQLRAEGVRAIVLDLRFSGGHSDNVQAAALVANGFLDSGLLWRVTDFRHQVKEYRAGPECLFRQWPLAVLINEGTQDEGYAAFAAALQDNSRAIVVGEPTGADGYVTSVIGLPDQMGAIGIHTGRLERAAKGRGWPVQPDHRVPSSKQQRKVLANWIHYKGFPELPAGVEDKPPEDPQLKRAVELLREQMQVAERQGDR
jgi:C-terminal peptidase prc